MRPVRAVTLTDDGRLTVQQSGGFTTLDPALADEVARRLDRDDPLPCPHSGDWIEVTALGRPGPQWLCADCSELRTGDRP